MAKFNIYEKFYKLIESMQQHPEDLVQKQTSSFLKVILLIGNFARSHEIPRFGPEEWLRKIT